MTGIRSPLKHKVEIRPVSSNVERKACNAYSIGIKNPCPDFIEGTVYILECSDGSYYVGSTTNLKLRLQEHSEGKSTYTSAHLPVKLVYTEEYEDEHQARMREQQLHGWTRAKKEALISGDIEKLKQLSKKKDLS